MSDKTGRPDEKPTYRSYLLRLWWVKGGETHWRASLESAQTGERESFPTLDALFDYIRSQTSAGLGPVQPAGPDSEDGI